MHNNITSCLLKPVLPEGALNAGFLVSNPIEDTIQLSSTYRCCRIRIVDVNGYSMNGSVGICLTNSGQAEVQKKNNQVQ